MEANPYGPHGREARRHGLGVLACVALIFQMGCATGTPGWSSLRAAENGFSRILRPPRPSPAEEPNARNGEANNGGKLALGEQTAGEERRAAAPGREDNGGTTRPEGGGSRAHQPAA